MGAPIILAETNKSIIIPQKPVPLVHTWSDQTIEKHKEKSKDYSFALIYDLDHLYLSYRKAKSGCDWKKSVQLYEKNSLYNLYNLYRSLIEQTYHQRDFYEFTLQERGKVRRIKAMYVEDRIVQRCLSDWVLTPVVQDYLIYDNGASLENKGVDFCRRRLETHLHKFYRHHGTDGYILMIDFSKFFDNLLHDYAKQILYDVIYDDKLRFLIDMMIDSFRQDVSYMDDDEYSQCLISTFNSIDYQFLSEGKKTGDRFMEKSVGIGSHISQICGIFYPSELDNFCKIVQGLKYYGRYMDDTYIIHQDKEYLQNLLIQIDNLCRSIGLHVNLKKTQIVPLKHGFTYLQIKYNLTESGHLIRRIPRKSFIRERRRLKSLNRLVECGRMTYSEVGQCYKSWRGNIEKYDSHDSLMTMDRIFYEIFGYDYEELVDNDPIHFFPDDVGLDRKYYTCNQRWITDL